MTRKSGGWARQTRESRRPSARGSLSQERVLDAALRLVDEHGLECLSMRRLGSELGVEAMSLYNHVSGKDALLDDLTDRLWAQVQLPLEDGAGWTWQDAVRPTLRSLRALAQAHPKLYPLLMACKCLPDSALRVFDALLEALRRGGFDTRSAGYALGTLVAYAAGYGFVELACGLGPSDAATQCRLLPDADPRFADLAEAFGECDCDRQFEIGLRALLAGLEAVKTEDL